MNWFRRKKKNLYEPYLVEHKNPDGSVEHYNPTYLVPQEDGSLDWSSGYKDAMRDQVVLLSSGSGTNNILNSAYGWDYSGSSYSPFGNSIEYRHIRDDNPMDIAILTCKNCGTRYLFDRTKSDAILTVLSCQQCGGRL